MNAQTFALVAGIVFVLVGIAGFVPGLVTAHDATQHQFAVEQGAGDLFGIRHSEVDHAPRPAHRA